MLRRATFVSVFLALASLASGASPGPSAWAPADASSMQPPDVDREFRAVWVASVVNIDWPSKRGLTVAEQRDEIIAKLDLLQRLGFNAVLLQVRPSADALYLTDLEPWSEYLTGQSGKAPDPIWDPLAVWIDESHRRAIDLHVWINPFRSRHFRAESPDAPTHINNTHPHLVRDYDNYKWLDPGEPDAVEHTMRVVLDIVRRYDIDGVAIDDYFYPYPKDNVPFPDDATYARYVAAFTPPPDRPDASPLPLKAWREDNINRFVQRFYADIKAAKPWVLVGISPFGIWRPGNPPGVRGMDAVDRLHADARLWLQKGWLDYLSPQLYWALGAPAQPYAPLLDWWIGENELRRHLWPSNYTGRIGAPANERNANNWEPAEIIQQIEETRMRSGPIAGGASGNIHFSLSVFQENRRDINAAMAQAHQRPALVPATPWSAAPADRRTLLLASQDQSRLALAWLGIAEQAGQPQAARRWILQVRRAGAWETQILPAQTHGITLTDRVDAVDAVVLTPVRRNGTLGEAVAWARTPAPTPAPSPAPAQVPAPAAAPSPR